MIRIFVSGCYDIIHAGHLQFFREARALGDHLTVSFASQEVLWRHKQRNGSLPDEHKLALLLSLDPVDDVVIGEDDDLGLDFKSHFLQLRPNKLVVTEDDQYGALKQALCAEVGAEYVVLPKTPPQFPPTSTSKIVRFIRAPKAVPLRVDFAGGWLDVPRYARQGAFVVNCAISPTVALREWPYQRNAGLGGSGAWALLNGEDGVKAELDLGVGWQDPAVIAEGGLCVWSSGPKPELEIKTNGAILRGRMALLWTGSEHSTPAAADRPRDYEAIERASQVARRAVWNDDFDALSHATALSYQVQLAEGMNELPPGPAGAVACKYCGGGFGGYALYLFETPAARDNAVHAHGLLAIEPFLWPR
jgi:cytidyltransferase-like protein